MRKSSADYRCKKKKNHIGDKFWAPDANRGHESSALAGGRAFVIIWVAAGRARLNYQSSTRWSHTVSLFLDAFKNTWRYLLNINGVQVAHRLMHVLFWWITKGWWCLMHKTGCSLLGGGGGLWRCLRCPRLEGVGSYHERGTVPECVIRRRRLRRKWAFHSTPRQENSWWRFWFQCAVVDPSDAGPPS